ncbi:MAG: amidohydrolase family protein [Chitinophagaceae bacterium]|nr:amidohydrolase family protein [Chitinophagaceae bacterium]
MRYNKFSATQLFDGYNFLPSGKVLITSAEGVIIDIVDAENAGDDVQFFDGILSPGFINCHCHLELSHLKSAIPQKTGLVNFVQAVMTNRAADAEIKTDAMQQADAQMYNSGIVAIGDICNTADSLPVKQNSKIRWHNFVEVSGFVEATAEKRLKEMIEVASKLSIANCPLSIVPHAPYSVSKKMFSLINALPNNNLITIHNQESEEENKLYQNKEGNFLELYKNLGIDISSFVPSGKTSLQTWLPYFTNNQRIIAVHNTFTNVKDVDFQIAHCPLPVAYCLCPNANLYIENTLPPIDLLINNNCNIVLGTDSLASNTQLNMLEEIKTIQQQFPQIELQTLLQWATSNGAAALQMNDKFGSFEKGKQPGIVLIAKELESSKRIL